MQQAVFKLYLQDGREYLWQCSNKQERDVWAMSVSASVRSQGFTVQVLLGAFIICTAGTSQCSCPFACNCYEPEIYLFMLISSDLRVLL